MTRAPVPFISCSMFDSCHLQCLCFNSPILQGGRPHRLKTFNLVSQELAFFSKTKWPVSCQDVVSSVVSITLPTPLGNYIRLARPCAYITEWEQEGHHFHFNRHCLVIFAIKILNIFFPKGNILLHLCTVSRKKRIFKAQSRVP